MTDYCIHVYIAETIDRFSYRFSTMLKCLDEKKAVLLHRKKKKKRLFSETKKRRRRRTSDIHYTNLPTCLPACLPAVVDVAQYAGETDCSVAVVVVVTSSLIREWNILRRRNYTDGRLAARNKLVRCRGKSIWADNLTDAAVRRVITCY